ncbi:PA domain-containing protein [Lentzea sp. NPDC051213]|uniref:PA domain-containing protein n=1 Tax=Lentzea sp. NPDC051213 TaxID=3364126 RepID=UPI0037AE2A0A
MRPARCLAFISVVTIFSLQLTAPATAAEDCPASIDDRTFASASSLRELNATVAGFGLRATGSPAHKRLISWLERRVTRLPGISVRSEQFRIQRWHPGPGLLLGAGGAVPVASAIPYSAPGLRSGTLVKLPAGEPITAANARGKVVLRDFPAVDRGYFAEPLLHQDMVDAGTAGAAGVVVAFPFPHEQVRGYWDPHVGTHYRVPGVFVGADAALKLQVGTRTTIGVLAGRSPATTRSLIATLPGLSSERIVIDTNTDGVGWVQENGTVALLALAEHFARLPLRCRPRTLEFVFATGHLHRPAEGSEFRARALDADYDSGSVAFAFVLEHLGTREYLPSEGELRATGAAEISGWFAGSPVLAQTATTALAGRAVDRTIVLPGSDTPVPGRAPPQCSFGGIGTHFHSHLVPTMAMISGPWTLWAPSFGADAVDHERMRRQVLAAGDAVLALGAVPREQIAGPYLDLRQARAGGAPTCSHDLPPEWAPR